MDRRTFLRQTGMSLTALVAAASAFEALPAAAAATTPATAFEPVRNLAAAPRLTVTRLAMPAAGTYRVSGTVRLEAPTVEISGIANSQQITWSSAPTAAPMVVSFQSFETFDGAALPPSVTVRGGKLESLTVTPVIE